MFAAAAVAAAAALTAISTTSTSNSYPNGPTSSVYGAGGIVNAAQSLTNHTSNNNNATTSNDPNSRPRAYISWAQYAHQRRNSLQRRKVEISKRLEKASNPNNRGINKSNSPSNQKDNLLKNTSNQKLYDANGNRLRPREKLIDPNSIINIPFDLNQISHLSEDDPLLKELRANVVNEFLKMHSITTDDENKDKLNKLAYDNFNLIGNGLSIGADGHTQLDINEISQLLLQFIQSENLIDLDFSSDQNPNNKLDKLNSINQPLSSQQSQQENFLYTQRWEPRWLRKIRNIFSIPIAIVTLVFLIITNVDSNWVNLENDHRAGLWAICNKTIINKPEPTSNIVESSSTINYSNNYEINNETSDLVFSNTYSFTSYATHSVLTSTQSNQLDLASTTNSISNNIKNINKSSLLEKLNKKTKLLFKKNTELQEDCFSRFFLKEDGQLVVLAISLVAILFHFIGLILLFIGLVFVASNRTLYYYHSAGECLISSALLNGLDVLAFATLVSSQVEQTYIYGYCFYLNMLISLITFFSSALLFIDDLINEYRSWRYRNMRMNLRKSADPAYLPT